MGQAISLQRCGLVLAVASFVRQLYRRVRSAAFSEQLSRGHPRAAPWPEDAYGDPVALLCMALWRCQKII